MEKEHLCDERVAEITCAVRNRGATSIVEKMTFLREAGTKKCNMWV